MYTFSTPVTSARRRMDLAMNSGPLSLRMCTGTPRVVNRPISTSATSPEVIERFTSSARHSRVNSSTMLSHFKARPRSSVSWMKSMAHT